eukprot:NODE_3090_length_707_cov_23.711246_g2183_i0.p2 GENE.NODE_3090_length_707_cov_23.711246_g2183_i0~~NODE_3090_length_707_cov_23.711246_g2183_i0.p2  ORF type:complete len:158 (-),score=32.53 NODE_3090_length_707_cov_23.711246_g2183_i0:169-642(-)
MAVATKWESAPAIPKAIQDLPQEWPTQIHRDQHLLNGPSLNRVESFIAASQIRSAVYHFLLSGFGHGNTNSNFNFSKEQMRARTLKASGNIWYLEPQSYLQTQGERLVGRANLTIKARHNSGKTGLRNVHKPYLFAPTAILGLAYYYRWTRFLTLEE